MKDLSAKTDSYNFDINMEVLIELKKVCDESIGKVKEKIQLLNNKL